jgi:hypothetical protein
MQPDDICDLMMCVYLLRVMLQVGRKSAATAAIASVSSSSTGGQQHEQHRAVWAEGTITIHSRCQVSTNLIRTSNLTC